MSTRHSFAIFLLCRPTNTYVHTYTIKISTDGVIIEVSRGEELVQTDDSTTVTRSYTYVFQAEALYMYILCERWKIGNGC